MTPTNDAPVTVEQIAARLIDQSDEPDWTGGNYSERMNYWRDKAIDCSNRLAALASAPAGDHVRDAPKMVAPAGDGVEEAEAVSVLRRISVNARLDWLGRDDRNAVLAALARPRAAVGEREAVTAIVQMVRKEAALNRAVQNIGTHPENVGRALEIATTLDALADRILALQSPPAKVEG